MADEESLESKLQTEFKKELDGYVKYISPEEQEKRDGLVNNAHFEGYKAVKAFHENLTKDGKVPKRGKSFEKEDINKTLELYLENFGNNLNDEHHKLVFENYKKTKFDNHDDRRQKLFELYQHMGLEGQDGGAASNIIGALESNKFTGIDSVFNSEFHKGVSDVYHNTDKIKKFKNGVGQSKFMHKGFGKYAIENLGDGRYKANLDENGIGKIHGKEVAQLKPLIDNAAQGNYLENKDLLDDYGIKKAA